MAAIQPLDALDNDPLGTPMDYAVPTATRQLRSTQSVKPRPQMPLNPRYLIVAGVIVVVLIIVIPLGWMGVRAGMGFVAGLNSSSDENAAVESDAEAEPETSASQESATQDPAGATATASIARPTPRIQQPVEQTPTPPPAFRYGWQSGQKYRYEYELAADLMGQAITGSGHVEYSPGQVGGVIVPASGQTTGARDTGPEQQVALSYTGSLQMKWPSLLQSSGGGPFGNEPAAPPGPAGGGPFGADPFGGGPAAADPFARRPGRSAPNKPPSNENGKIVVDVTGEYVQGDMKVFLPFVMTPLGMLAIEPLGNGEPAWNRERAVTLTGTREQEDDSPFGGFHPAAMDPFAARAPAAQQQPVEVQTAMERYEYHWGDSTADTVVLHKSYSLETERPSNDQPHVNVNGEGQIIFDKQAAVPQSMTYKLDFTLQQENIAIKIPVTFSYQRVGS
jgi:hypothetical protein